MLAWLVAYGDDWGKPMRPFAEVPETHWPELTGKLHVYIAAPDPVRELAATYQAAIAPHTDLVSLQPVEFLHATVAPIERYRSNVTDDELAKFADLLQQRLHMPAFEMTVGPAIVGVHGVALYIPPPADAFMALSSDVRATATSQFSPSAVKPVSARWKPHMSLGYGLAAGDPDPLLRAVNDVRAQPVTFTVDHVDLVAVDYNRPAGTFSWSTIATIALDG